MDSTLRGGKRTGAGRKKGITLKEKYGDQLPDKIKESIYKLNELEKS